MPNPADLWRFLPIGYVLTVAVEAPILFFALVGLRPAERVFAGLWLTACTYPIVMLVLPLLIPEPHWEYLLVAETFAPLAECALFAAVYGRDMSQRGLALAWNLGVITLANLASFGFGRLLESQGWIGR